MKTSIAFNEGPVRHNLDFSHNRLKADMGDGSTGGEVVAYLEGIKLYCDELIQALSTNNKIPQTVSKVP